MTVIGKTSHAIFFNGLSDSIVCPLHNFQTSGVKIPIGDDIARSSRPLVGSTRQEGSIDGGAFTNLDNFSIEAWVRPDCGGVIAFKEGLFKLSIGDIHQPAPAVFSVDILNANGSRNTYTASSGTGLSSGYSGITYPTSSASFIGNNKDTSSGTRELLHVAGVFSNGRVSVMVNGELVASTKASENGTVEISNTDLLIGGEGGQYRGYIESVHWRRDTDPSNIYATPFVKGPSTLGLWRFEEPVEVEKTIFYLKSNVNPNDTTLTLDTTQVQSLYEIVSGKDTSMPSTYSIPTLGDYQVGVTTHSGGAQVVKIAHTTVNLLINPTGTDINTGKPNSKPPERVRLKSISSDGTITVESIHLDFGVSSDTGARGVLHGRTAFDSTNNLAKDSTIVVLMSDLLLDEGTGQPIQPPGLGSQAVDSNGMTVIDESDNRNHGFIFSRRLSINETNNPYTVTSANWSVDDKFQVGHSGRHCFSHLSGHPYLRVFPQSNSERTTQTMDGMSDSIEVRFDGMSLGLSNQVPVNSSISLFQRGNDAPATNLLTTGVVSQIIRNGLSSLDPDRDGIIAIGGANFDIRPFLLKGHSQENITSSDDIYNFHLAPEGESRIAILETGDSDIPYIEIHYNAIDLTGDTIGTSGAALLVEKTVPSGGSVINSKRVADRVNTLLQSGTMTLHSAGGLIRIDQSNFGGAAEVLKPHLLVGDNTGGTQYEVELDNSRIPSNYTPSVATDEPNSPPLGVPSSHADNSTHPSVYHHIIIRPTQTKKDSDLTTSGTHYKLAATSGNKGGSNHSSHVFEMFDIIDNDEDSGGNFLIVQPTDRSRTLQLKKFSIDHTDPSLFSVEFLVSRGRVSSFEETHDGGNVYLTMKGRGLMDDIASMVSDYDGEGAPNSVIVKETKPDAPIVTVTLGGPGQGAVETTPTWDKSPLTREGWNTRRDGGAIITAADSSARTITIAPLNNESDALASWGTYMFPSKGRVHLENGASAEYDSITATVFNFNSTTTSNGSGRFMNNDGTEEASFAAWYTQNSLPNVGSKILLDPLFDEASVVADGTTLNDRLFQSLGSVTHDYQLGTQYASTRALVEIPVFSNQFFDDPFNGVFPGPDNSMKIHLDPTLTAHSWAPNPVGRRPRDYAPVDRDVIGPYHDAWIDGGISTAVKVVKIEETVASNETTVITLQVEDVDASFPIDSSANTIYKTYTNLKNADDDIVVWRRIYLPNGAWGLPTTVNTTTNKITVPYFSDNFAEGLSQNAVVSLVVSMGDIGTPIRDDPSISTSINEFRRPHYYDRANVQTQGGNIDYGLRQYVSAVEFKEGPTANPHAEKIESGAAKIELISESSSGVWEYTGDNVPLLTGSSNPKFEAVNDAGDVILFYHTTNASTIDVTNVTGTAAAGEIFTIRGVKKTTNLYHSFYDGYDDNMGMQDYYAQGGVLNKTWNNAFAPGGLRHGDTIWMNMHYTNPHAIEGLFCKSRGVLNEFMVWNGFNGGRGELGAQASDSIPLENFLIGNTCLETAQNFVQHVNKTVELNWLELGYSASEAPVIAYLDPYLAKAGHVRVLLYDVAHDREFIAFHDIHMQVQTGQATPRVNGLDVANGFHSQRMDKNLGTTTNNKSDFIEGAYAHRSSPYMQVTASGGNPNIHSMNDAWANYGKGLLGTTARTDNSTVRTIYSNQTSAYRHSLNGEGTSDTTFCDTPDGTRVIPAFLCLKGNRANSLDLTGHSESRLQHLPQWTQMDFVRRLTLDLGEIGQSDGVSDTESAVREMIRRVNQAAALQASAEGGSAHDPAPFWDDTAFSGDKGSHMGYLRAHFGRAVKDLNGNDGYTIVIHSTVPGASGRNFCAWLDNSRGQAAYQPQFLVGHGGRFRSFWCMPTEGEDENMHPAPMPITKNGRPFAPITTLNQMVPVDGENLEVLNNLASQEANDTTLSSRVNTEMATGRGANTVYSESFESQGDSLQLVKGLRPGGRARARINFGGLVASGVPGWAPDAGPMGFGMANKGGRFDEIYGSGPTSYSSYVTTEEQSSERVGDSELYGFKFTDHRGEDHTIRLVYRQKGIPFNNSNTVLPPSLENEIIISFDDRDISKGGFTIGKHMKGSVYPATATNESLVVQTVPDPSWRGNLWNGIRAPANGYLNGYGGIGTPSYDASTKTLGVDIVDNNAPSGTSLDYLGHLGFPKEGGFILYTDNAGTDTSMVLRYTSRSTNNGTGNTAQEFYGITTSTGGNPDVTNLSSSGEYGMISPILNWTTIVTDELIAAAVEYAMGVDPNNTSAFDCSEMYAPDGRTYREWMGEGAATAIQVHTMNEKTKVKPLKDLFSVTRDRDWGLYAGCVETDEAKGGLSSTQITNGVAIDCGYIPRTILNIVSNFRGEKANTPTPTLIKSDGSNVSTAEWQKHLRGEKFTAYAGDHITPCVNNPVHKATNTTPTPAGDGYVYVADNSWLLPTHAVNPASTAAADGRYFSEPFLIYDTNDRWAKVRFGNNERLLYIDAETSFTLADNDPFTLWTGERARLFAGSRIAGNTYGEPLTYFRGAHDSPDHSVPLYFGGGFSGVVMDINDGTQNDYTEFYSHPYASGPTGCAGLQNVGENMGAHAILDTTAMLAMFPGTPFLNQHRGESQPPFSNADALLAPDINVQSGGGSSLVGNSAQEMGFTGDTAAINSAKDDYYQDATDSIHNQTAITHPIPIVLRFAHPYARYTDDVGGSAEEVAYVVFGPGQSVPKHFYGYTNSTLEPSANKTVEEKTTHIYNDTLTRKNGTENGVYHPNELSKGYKTSNVYTNRSGNYRPYLPPPMSYQKSAPYPFSVLRNWEPSHGTPANWYRDPDTAETYANDFTSSDTQLVSNHWGTLDSTAKKAASLKIAHPVAYEHSAATVIALSSAAIDSYHYHWHMDGGYPAGGNWFDFAVRKNPPHPVTGNVLKDSQTTTVTTSSETATVTLGLNASMFRVGSVALTDYDSTFSQSTPSDVFIVDATRVQNSEELATVISAAINSYPGKGNLKALGGTFLPSFQDAIRQDRYSWVNVGSIKSSTGYLSSGGTVTASGKLPTTLPTKGWIRLENSGTVYYGRYSSYSATGTGTEGIFTLAKNWRFDAAKLEQPDVTATTYPTVTSGGISSSTKIYVWAKTGNLRWSNGAPEALHATAIPTSSNTNTHIYHHLASTQVHFNGFVDAIDRTRPVGAVGWHGERYSYLNSLKVAKTSSGHGISAGLGAWHPMLGFNPYGPAMNAHSMNGATGSYGLTDYEVGYNLSNGAVTATYTQDATGLNSGLHPRHYVVVSNEGELPIIAKADRDGLILCGDMLDKRWGVQTNQSAATTKTGGTVIASHAERHNNDRFVAYAHGGPHVDAQYVRDFAPPTSGDGEWAANVPTSTEIWPMETCLFPTGDLFFDKVENPGVARHPSEAPIKHDHIQSDTLRAQSGVLAKPYTFWKGDGDGTSSTQTGHSAARNFFTNHIVWKRMDGGNLCMPAPNARGLGATPWVWRKVGSSYVKFGETIYGNTRFSFETTNAAAFPTIQAQELAHPQLEEKYPLEVGGVLDIPNEEIQFESIMVVDDAGQEHKIEGGSPLGTVIRDFSRVVDRDIKGPALAASGNQPNIKINLPDPNTIPGNVIVRSGFDKIQAYQHETMGTGGMHRPDLPDTVVDTAFDTSNSNPSTKPFWENQGWERLDEDKSLYQSKSGSMSNKAPLQTSYEPHDRALYFHLTEMGWGYTEREPLGIVNNDMAHNPLTFDSVSGAVLTTNETITASIWQAEQTPDGRSFLSVNGHVVSFTGVSGSTFTGCKFTPGFTATDGDTMKPSFYIPAGSTRHFAARRLRDHAEVSGESPDKAPIDWVGVDTDESPAKAIRSNRLTPMPIPRMGHHYVTPTMAVMPGHLSHPLYQRVYSLNRAYMSATTSIERDLGYDNMYSVWADGQEGVGINPLLWFSSPSSPHPPSDIHGGAFTLMVETKVKYDGYGILAFDNENNDGDHRLTLETGSNYGTHWHFPDPAETGAYQIIIQPNLFAQQLMGFNTNYDFGSDSGTQYPLLTDQQVATVIAVEWNSSNSAGRGQVRGTYDFILAEALKVDVRGCEVFLNEMILDIDPSPNQQFTSLPPLALYNTLGVNESTSPAWSRKSLPYSPGMFRLASPGYTLTVPWWAPAIKSGSGTGSDYFTATANQGIFASTNAWRKTEHYHPEDYYHYCRTGYGSIGSQSVMAGYPTHYLHPYLHSYISLAPTCTIKKAISGSTQILVDNNSLFPEVGLKYFGHKLQVTDDDGTIYTATYTHRGQASGDEDNTTNRFYGVTGSTEFWAAAKNGKTLKLTGDYATLGAGEVYSNKLASVAAHQIEDLREGTKDTATGHLPDAYLSMWHYNLGRPMTYYSDSRTETVDAAIDKAPYNHLPEHYETIHYHDFGYVISDGPFDFRAFGWTTAGGTIVTPGSMSYPPQARTDDNSNKYHYGSFWPGGSRFGAQASKMDLWGTAGPGWGKYWDLPNVKRQNPSDSEGDAFDYISLASISDTIVWQKDNSVTQSVDSKRNISGGYRFCLRGPTNRPRAALWSTQAFDDVYSSENPHSTYRPGSYIQNDAVTGELYTAVADSDSVTVTTPTTAAGYSGIIERITNASAMLGSDLKGQQVRYSHGRRITRPFGCSVRNIVNEVLTTRLHPGDYPAGFGSNDDEILDRKRNLASAQAHYMIDWWGNTTGEDVRRFPVRGFGIRPSWDSEDAYRATDRSNYNRAKFHAPSHMGHARPNIDSFDPATAKRVGDRGDGRGVRWPTTFNEDMFQEVDTIVDATGLVLSAPTAEPSSGLGYIRPRNDDLAVDEIKRGISRRLDVAATDGLLKPEAMAGANVEKAKNDLLPANQTLQEPISRIAPRIGLDAPSVEELTGGSSTDHVAIATEAHSLHTDRVAGRRYIVAGGIEKSSGNITVGDFNLGYSGGNHWNFSTYRPVMRLNYTHGIWPMGGTLILDLENYLEPISDQGWGASSGRGSNPYQSGNHNPLSSTTNIEDKLIRFLLRPVRVLDHRHIEVFRDETNALSGTAGGKYGLFTYSTPNARATTSSRFLRSSNPATDNPPYAPAYFFASGGAYTSSSSSGPNIPGTEASGFTNSLKQTVARISISNNTLQHLRADANRRGDFTIQPRYTQSLYPGTNLNKSDHSGESSHSDNEVDG